jgi:hypothetical protein
MKKLVFGLTSFAVSAVHVVAAAMPPSDPCVPDPCQNGGTCQFVTITEYACDCAPGYTGTNCEYDIDECESSPCVHGACQDQVNGYACDCDPSWTGALCDSEVSGCASFPCQNGGNCNDTGGGTYTCECLTGWTGTNCDEIADPCVPDPCANGACTSDASGYSCVCDPGWTGGTCEIDIDECESSPCVNGFCADEVNGYSCACDPGWTGGTCEIDIDECESSPCVNGQCVDEVNSYSCQCNPGWAGPSCDNDVNDCEADPCVHGDCTDLVNAYECDCNPGYTGGTCEIDIDECESSPCVNGQCVDEINSYSCQCNPGWTGTNCDVSDDPCASDTTPPAFDAGSLAAQTVAGSCGAGDATITLPTATDACSVPNVTCTAVALGSAGANVVTCTATDGAGNTAQAELTVNVLSPLRVAFQSPLADDNAANDISTDADVANLFKVGQTIPHKVKLYNCSNQDVTASVAGSVTVSLAVYAGASNSGTNLVNDLNDYTGVGDVGGLMTYTDGHFQFNLKANSGDYTAGGAQYSSVVTAVYNSAPLTPAGVEDARLKSK